MQNRLLAASIALSAALGLAGLAQAQTTPNPAATPTTPGAQQPSQSETGNSPMQGSDSSGSAMTTPNTGTNGYNAQQANQQMTPSASHATVREAQQALKTKGLYSGRIDGIMGPRMKTAISQFQRRNGLPQTAMLDQETLSRLVSGANTQNPNAPSQNMQ
jgi:peptidoglycan hydrolase-like protein with peptidoglycan-binding domain